MLSELEDENWEEVFKYATPDAVVGENISTAAFTREDVAKVLHLIDGDYDGPDWVAAGLLRDGRYFVIRAGCDYTGWG